MELHWWGQVVVPVNLSLVCGRGLAKQWKDKYSEDYDFIINAPEFMNAFREQAPKDIPDYIETMLNGDSYFFVYVNPEFPRIRAGFYYGLILINSVILFPVKYNWREAATLELIEKSLKKLHNLTFLKKMQVYLPRIGCGFGELDWETKVKPLVEKYQLDSWTVVDPSNHVYDLYRTSFIPSVRRDKRWHSK